MDTVPGASPAVAEAMRARFTSEPSPYVREELVQSIAALDSVRARDVVVLALRDVDATVRKAAVEHSYVIAKSERIGFLRPLLSDSSYRVAIFTLGMMSATDTTGLMPYFLATKGVKGRRDHLAEAWLNGVGVGKFEGLVNDVVDYTTPAYSKDTRAKAYMVLGDLKSTTPEVRTAIERGLETSGFVRSSAAGAARSHLDDGMRAGLKQLRDRSSGEQREVIEDILDGKQ
jgi:HEAT repeat protein